MMLTVGGMRFFSLFDALVVALRMRDHKELLGVVDFLDIEWRPPTSLSRLSSLVMSLVGCG